MATRSHRRTLLAMTVLAGVSALPLIAYAQAPPAAPPTPPTPAAADQGSTVGEVVVTAQRRAERLKDVPIAITAITAQQLERSGIATTSDLSQVTPGLHFGVTGGFAQPTIRGIGTSITSAGSDANVAIYIDGVYMANQNSNLFDFADVERIEVLKGPQGTLYGRNATGGAINITTFNPSYQAHGTAALSYASFNEVKFTGFVTAPIVPDVLAASLSVIADTNDGYTNDIVAHQKLSSFQEYGVRGKLRWDPTPKLQIVASADAEDTNDLRGYTTTVLNGNVIKPQTVIPTDPYDVAFVIPPEFAVRAAGGSVTAKYDFGPVMLSSITAYRSTNTGLLTLSGDPMGRHVASFNVWEKTWTEELNLASQMSGPLKWVGGVYLYDDESHEDNLKSAGVQILDRAHVNSKSVAAYGQFDYTFLDKFVLTGGLRYSDERRSYFASRSAAAARGAATVVDTATTFPSWTPRVVLKYNIDPKSNVYVSYTEGFKSGTYNVSSFSTLYVSPEKVKAFEAGYKYADRRLSFDASAFHYDYDNIQVQAIANTGAALSTLLNAARAKIYGADGEARLQVTDELQLQAGAAWTHARYTSFPGAIAYNPLPAGGNAQAKIDASGKRMIRAPELTGNVGFYWHHDAFGGKFDASANEYLNSGFYWDPANRVKQGAYQTLNAQIGWSPAGANWRVSIFGRNLTDKTYELVVQENTFADAVAYQPPRQVGVQLSASF